MSIRPIGGAALIKLDPNAGEAVRSLARAMRGDKAITMVGKTWRLREARWPTDTSAKCLLTERWDGERWVAVLALSPDTAPEYAPLVPPKYTEATRPAASAALDSRFILMQDADSVWHMQVCLAKSNGTWEWKEFAQSSG